MVEFIAGVAVGVGGMIAKDKFLGNENSAKQQAQQREIDNLCNENDRNIFLTFGTQFRLHTHSLQSLGKVVVCAIIQQKQRK